MVDISYKKKSKVLSLGEKDNDQGIATALLGNHIMSDIGWANQFGSKEEFGGLEVYKKQAQKEEQSCYPSHISETQ